MSSACVHVPALGSKLDTAGGLLTVPTPQVTSLCNEVMIRGILTEPPLHITFPLLCKRFFKLGCFQGKILKQRLTMRGHLDAMHPTIRAASRPPPPPPPLCTVQMDVRQRQPSMVTSCRDNMQAASSGSRDCQPGSWASCPQRSYFNLDCGSYTEIPTEALNFCTSCDLKFHL